MLLCNLAVHDAAGIIYISVFPGFFSGLLIATPPMLSIHPTKNTSKVGTRIGMIIALLGLEILLEGLGGGGVL